MVNTSSRPQPLPAAVAPASSGQGRARIMREARALFTATGYAAVSMQQIADAAAVNKATLYHHFRDKEDLFVAIMGEEFAALHDRIAAAVAAGGGLRLQLRRVATTVFTASPSDFGRLAADLRAHVSAERRARLLAHHGAPWQVIRPAIARAVAAGEVGAVDPDLAARLFFGMVGSQIWWSKLADEWPAPDERVAAAIADLVLDGIGPGPGRPPAAPEAAARGDRPAATEGDGPG